jgi:hypothetical protein
MLTARATKCIPTIFASVMLLASPLSADSVEIVAKDLCVSPRTLQRRLDAA